jgi:hypothetical protein
MPAERNRADRLGDLRADRVMVQPILGHGAIAPAHDEELARATQERSSLCLAGPRGHGAQFVERERLARGAQDAEAVDDDRIGRDLLP